MNLPATSSRPYKKDQAGTILLIATSITIIMTIVVTSTLMWVSGLSTIQENLPFQELLENERSNIQKIVALTVRSNLNNDNEDPLQGIGDILKDPRNVTIDHRNREDPALLYLDATNSTLMSALGLSEVNGDHPDFLGGGFQYVSHLVEYELQDQASYTANRGASAWAAGSPWFNPNPSLGDDSDKITYWGSSPMAHLKYVQHPYKTRVSYTLRYWKQRLPSNTNYFDFYTSMYNSLTNADLSETFKQFNGQAYVQVREIPTCQIQLTSIDRMDIAAYEPDSDDTYVPYNTMTTIIGGNNAGAAQDGSGMAFFPYGVMRTDDYDTDKYTLPTSPSPLIVINDYTPNSYLPRKGYTISPADIRPPSDPSDPYDIPLSAAHHAYRPAMGVSWLYSSPYLLSTTRTEERSPQNFINRSDVTVRFNGREILSPAPPPPGFTVEETIDNVPRLYIDLASILSERYYIECTNLMAKRRGIVLRAPSEDTHHGFDYIFTNGAIILDGSPDDTNPGDPANMADNTPLLCGSNYGSYTFYTNPGGLNTPLWRAYIVALVPPSSSFEVSAGAPGSQLFEHASLNYDSVTLSGQLVANASTNGINVGFSHSGGETPDTCWVNFTNGSLPTVYAMDSYLQPLQLGIASSQVISTGSTYNFQITLHRGRNILSTRVYASGAAVPSPEINDLGVTGSEYECNYASWSASLSDLRVIGRSHGASFHGMGAVTTPTIRGGILTGKRLTGSLSTLIINEDIFDDDGNSHTRPVLDTPDDLLRASDRFILSDY